MTGNIKTPPDVYSDFQILVSTSGGIFLGTKDKEYLLRNDKGELVKIDYDPQLLTCIHNTIKFCRFFRCKNENIHRLIF